MSPWEKAWSLPFLLAFWWWKITRQLRFFKVTFRFAADADCAVVDAGMMWGGWREMAVASRL